LQRFLQDTKKGGLPGRLRGPDPGERQQRRRERLSRLVMELQRESLALDLLGDDELPERHAW